MAAASDLRQLQALWSPVSIFLARPHLGVKLLKAWPHHLAHVLLHLEPPLVPDVASAFDYYVAPSNSKFILKMLRRGCRLLFW